jgi:hypothetical protein
MKQKVGELYGKPIVVGNPNEFEKYEIPLNDLSGGFDDGMKYYLIVNQNALSGKFECSERNSLTVVTNLSGKNGIQRNTNVDIFSTVAFQTSKAIKIDWRDGVLYDILLEELQTNNIDIKDESLFKEVTAKEYYSLLK